VRIAMPILLLVAMAGCGPSSQDDSRSSRPSSAEPLTIGKVDPTDGKAVAAWSAETCRYVPLNVLRGSYAGDGASKASIAIGVADVFPPETRDAAKRACLDAFAKR